MVVVAALIGAGALLVLAFWLQMKRFKSLREDTDFYAKRRGFGAALWFHLAIAPFYMALVMPFDQAKFRQRTQTQNSVAHSMSVWTFIARYAAHFGTIALLLLGLFVLALQSRDPSILAPARLMAVALLLYAFYWKWLFSSFILPVALAMQIVGWATGAGYNPLELVTYIFSLAFDEILAVKMALIYAWIVAGAIMGSAIFDIARLFEFDPHL